MATRNPAPDADTEKQIADPKGKFLIGFLAGLTALLAPLLTPVVSRGDLSGFEGVFGPSWGYSLLVAVLGVIWCLLIATVTMFIEWKEPKKPGETFFKALGIPAVLAGAIATTGQSFDAQATARNLNADLDTKRAELSVALDKVAESKGIGISNVVLPLNLLPTKAKPADKPGAPPQGAVPARRNDGLAAALLLRPGGPPPDGREVRPVQSKEPLYVVSLARRSDQAKAEEVRAAATEKLPTATVVPFQGVYFVLADSQPLSKKDAVDFATRLTGQGFKPELVRVQ